MIDQSAVYGTEGTPDPGNVPSSRIYGQTWADAQGNLWLFGGEVFMRRAAADRTRTGMICGSLSDHGGVDVGGRNE